MPNEHSNTAPTGTNMGFYCCVHVCQSSGILHARMMVSITIGSRKLGQSLTETLDHLDIITDEGNFKDTEIGGREGAGRGVRNL